MSVPITVNSSGFLVLHNGPSYPLKGIGESAQTVVPQLPGGSIIERGVGDHPLTGWGTSSGSMRADFLIPNSGTVSVAFVVDQLPTPKCFIGIGVDLHSRPFAILTDGNGVVVAQTTPSGAFGTPGANAAVVLSWNALSGGVSLVVNGVASTDWTTTPSKPWLPWTPAALQLGVGNVNSLSDFTTGATPASAIKCVQLARK